MKITFHSWLKSSVGQNEAELTLPSKVKTVADLASHLADKYESAATVFEVPEALRYVIERRYVEPDHVLGDTTAVDIYPPVTGG